MNSQNANGDIKTENEDNEDVDNIVLVEPVKSFLGYTTAHGLGRVSDSTGFRRWVWIVFLLATYAAFSYHLSLLIVRYMDKLLLTSYDYELPYQFPDLYICPKNHPSMSRVAKPLTSVDISYLNTNLGLSRDAFRKLFQNYANNETEATKQVNLLDFNIWNPNFQFNDRYKAFSSKRSELEKVLLTVLDKNPPLKVGECYNLDDKGQYSYTGNLSTTVSGQTCLNWMDIRIPESYRTYNHNYCRNSDGSEKLPWCYIVSLDGSVGYEHCAVQMCYDSGFNSSMCFKRSDKGEFSYTGTTNKTVKGKTCLNWNSTGGPVAVAEKYKIYDHNYCRNPLKEETEPWCYTSDPSDDWDYCGVPQCPENDHGDCYRKVDNGFRSYFGTRSSTISGLTCQEWKKNYPHGIAAQYALYSHNYCRNPIGDLDRPWCFTTNKNTVWQACNVPQCVEEDVATVAEIIRDNIGKELTYAFGNDLFINLVDCDVSGIPCSKTDFTTFYHPSIGTCYKFNKEKFTKGKHFSAIAHLKLNMKLYSDANDLRGQAFVAVNEISLQAAMNPRKKSSTFSSSGFNLFVVPDGEFPHSIVGLEDTAVPIAGGLYSKVKLRYDEYVDYPDLGCLVNGTTNRVEYPITTWKSVLTSSNTAVDNTTANTISSVASNATWQTLLEYMTNNLTALGLEKVKTEIISYNKTKEDCINEFIIQTFISNCQCVPSFLPIPVHLMTNVSECFKAQFATKKVLLDRVKCYNKQIEQLTEITHKASNDCKLRCIRPSYLIETSATPWPEMTLQEMVTALFDVTSKFGYPKKFVQYRGITGLFFGYLFGQSLIYELQSGKTEREFTQNFTTFTRISHGVQSDLAKVTISGQTYGVKTIIDEAYPLKNLIADLGGLLGLYSGISVLTVLEVVELIIFIIALCRYKFAKRKYKQQKKKLDVLNNDNHQNPKLETADNVGQDEKWNANNPKEKYVYINENAADTIL